jgi:hypothetical protein
LVLGHLVLRLKEWLLELLELLELRLDELGLLLHLHGHLLLGLDELGLLLLLHLHRERAGELVLDG